MGILEAIKGRSPFVTNLTDFGVEEFTKTHYIVSEDFGDHNLFNFIQADYSIDEVRKMMRCLVEGVLVAHQAGVIHRDIKPSNVIVSEDMRTRLVDWGLAVFYHPGEKYNHMVGTRAYKAPELLVEWQKQDHSLDVWGLGMVLGCLVALSALQADQLSDGQGPNRAVRRHDSIFWAGDFSQVVH